MYSFILTLLMLERIDSNVSVGTEAGESFCSPPSWATGDAAR